MTWLEKVAELCKNAPKDYEPPLPKAGKYCTILGAVPKNLIALIWVSNQMILEIEAKGRAHQAVCRHNEGWDCQMFWREATSLYNQAKTIREIFFTSLREELEIDSKKHPNLEIVQGWNVSSVPEEDPMEELKKLLGGQNPMVMGKEIKDA